MWQPLQQFLEVELWQLFLSSDFGQQIAATFFGSLVGIPCGLWVSHRAERSSRSRRRRAFIKFTISSIEALRDSVLQIQENLRSPDNINKSTNYRPFSIGIEATAACRHEILSRELPLALEIDEIVYWASHVSRELNKYDKTLFSFEDGRLVQHQEFVEWLRNAGEGYPDLWAAFLSQPERPLRTCWAFQTKLLLISDINEGLLGCEEVLQKLKRLV